MLPQLVLEDELVKTRNERAVSTQVVVPAPLREEVFRSLHKPAHHGYKATLFQILQRFWLPRVQNDVSAFVRACEICDLNRVANLSQRAPLRDLPAG